jgi:hypothetical protein
MVRSAVLRAHPPNHRENPMKKLALNIDALKVQTFEVVAGDGDSEGTVLAAELLLGTRPTRCYSECNACTYTNCRTDERTELDCFC